MVDVTIIPHTTRAAGTILTATIYNTDHEVHISNVEALLAAINDLGIGTDSGGAYFLDLFEVKWDLTPDSPAADLDYNRQAVQDALDQAAGLGVPLILGTRGFLLMSGGLAFGDYGNFSTIPGVTALAPMYRALEIRDNLTEIISMGTIWSYIGISSVSNTVINVFGTNRLIIDRGAWSNLGVYAIGDQVTNSGVTYIAHAAVGPSATVPGSDTAHWSTLSIVNYLIGSDKNVTPDVIHGVRFEDLRTDINPLNGASVGANNGKTARFCHLGSIYELIAKGNRTYSGAAEFAGRDASGFPAEGASGREAGTWSFQQVNKALLTNNEWKDTTQGANFSFCNDVTMINNAGDSFSEFMDFDRQTRKLKIVGLSGRYGGKKTGGVWASSGQLLDLNSVQQADIEQLSAFYVGNIYQINTKSTTPETYAEYISGDITPSAITQSKAITVQGVRGEHVGSLTGGAVAILVGIDRGADPGFDGLPGNDPGTDIALIDHELRDTAVIMILDADRLLIDRIRMFDVFSVSPASGVAVGPIHLSVHIGADGKGGIDHLILGEIVMDGVNYGGPHIASCKNVTIRGPITLKNFNKKYRGAWVSLTTYNPGDMVTDAGVQYTNILLSNGSTAPGADATHWTAIGSAVPSGVDITGITGTAEVNRLDISAGAAVFPDVRINGSPTGKIKWGDPQLIHLANTLKLTTVVGALTLGNSEEHDFPSEILTTTLTDKLIYSVPAGLNAQLFSKSIVLQTAPLATINWFVKKSIGGGALSTVNSGTFTTGSAVGTEIVLGTTIADGLVPGDIVVLSLSASSGTVTMPRSKVIIRPIAYTPS